MATVVSFPTLFSFVTFEIFIQFPKVVSLQLFHEHIYLVHKQNNRRLLKPWIGYNGAKHIQAFL
jgi:hypothetical protein